MNEKARYPVCCACLSLCSPSSTHPFPCSAGWARQHCQPILWKGWATAEGSMEVTVFEYQIKLSKLWSLSIPTFNKTELLKLQPGNGTSKHGLFGGLHEIMVQQPLYLNDIGSIQAIHAICTKHSWLLQEYGTFINHKEPTLSEQGGNKRTLTPWPINQIWLRPKELTGSHTCSLYKLHENQRAQT